MSRARVCSHVLTRETGSKGQTGSKPPLEVVWLNANRMRIGSECAFRVDAPMRIEANWMRIQFAFVDKCGQALSLQLLHVASRCKVTESNDTRSKLSSHFGKYFRTFYLYTEALSFLMSYGKLENFHGLLLHLVTWQNIFKQLSTRCFCDGTDYRTTYTI